MAKPSDRFKQTIQFAPLSGRDPYGKPTLGSVESAPARIQPTNKAIVDANGAETVISRIIYTEAAITLTHRLWLPEDTPGDSSRMRRPVRIDDHVDGNGLVRFRKVYV